MLGSDRADPRADRRRAAILRIGIAMAVLVALALLAGTAALAVSAAADAGHHRTDQGMPGSKRPGR